jgi:hypothetical protein
MINSFLELGKTTAKSLETTVAKIQGVMTFGLTEKARLGVTDTLNAEVRHAGDIVEERSRGNAVVGRHVRRRT